MKTRNSINPDQVTVDDVWEHYQFSRDSIAQTADRTMQAIVTGSAIPDSRFIAMSREEVDEFFEAKLNETDNQACP
ncbi:MAG: hypothetical protein NTX50_11720 [Candidatus Sumerlaeota bacterium]|nr:hypothetical protein [Candidatus Sumerlaeota bacterium]